MRERAVVVREGEVRLHLRRVVIGAEPQVGGDRVGIDDLAGIQLPVGVPDRLELAESLDQLGPEHLRQQLRLRLAVSVLAGDRAAVSEDQVRGLVQKGAEGLDPGVAHQVEVPARVHAAVAVVAVERALVAVLAGQLAELPQVAAELLGRHCRVFPALVGVRLAGDEGGRAEACLADLPDVRGLLLVVVELHVLRGAGALLQL